MRYHQLICLSLLLTSLSTAAGVDMQKLHENNMSQQLLNESREQSRLLRENAELKRENNRLLQETLRQNDRLSRPCNTTVNDSGKH